MNQVNEQGKQIQKTGKAKKRKTEINEIRE